MLEKVAWIVLLGLVAMVTYPVLLPDEKTRAYRSCGGEFDPVLRQGCIDRALNQPNAAPAPR